MIINFFIGLIMGVISGFGVGGGSIFMVYLTTFAGYEHLVAGGINLVYYLFSATPALISHIKNRLVNIKAMIYCSISGVIFSVIGALLANAINTDILRKFFGVFLVIVGIILLFTKKSSTSK